MGLLENLLVGLAKAQKRHTYGFLVGILFFTLVVGYGAQHFTIETDFSEELPQDIPFFELQDKVNEKFGAQQVVIAVLRVTDESDAQSSVDDIRHPSVIKAMRFLDEELGRESVVQRTSSPAEFFEGEDIDTVEDVKKIIDENPQAGTFYSSDYRTALYYVFADIGNSDAKARQVVGVVEDYLRDAGLPAGVTSQVSGTPVLQITIFDLIVQDMIVTLSIAAVIILVLLFFIQRSVPVGLVVFTPLMLGLVWTMGTMGWLGIKLSLPTVAVGAMILGLGVEYGAFMVERYKEARKKGKDQEGAVVEAVHGIGSAISGSGLTTIIGFSALSFSVLPMLQHMGQILALGIFFSLLSALFVTPVFLLAEERLSAWWQNSRYDRVVKGGRRG